MEQTECSETSTCNSDAGNDPEESIQHLERGECLKSRNKYYTKEANKIPVCVCVCVCVCLCNDFN